MVINEDLIVAGQKSIDGKQYKTVGDKHVPYDSSADFLALIPLTRRHVGQIGYITNGTAIDTWHFVGGIADENFVLTLTPAYKIYVAIFYQNDTDDPEAQVLENTLGGDLVWTRIDVGIYAGTLAGAFNGIVPSIQSIIIPSTGIPGAPINYLYGFAVTAVSQDVFYVQTGTPTALADDVLHGNSYYSIEIRVYPGSGV